MVGLGVVAGVEEEVGVEGGIGGAPLGCAPVFSWNTFVQV